jgi:hypothetical protein
MYTAFGELALFASASGVCTLLCMSDILMDSVRKELLGVGSKICFYGKPLLKTFFFLLITASLFSY